MTHSNRAIESIDTVNLATVTGGIVYSGANYTSSPRKAAAYVAATSAPRVVGPAQGVSR